MKPYPHHIIEVARQLRQRQTLAEKILWQKLRKNSFEGLKFKRQHHIGRYVVDFYCAELKLIIELEGGIHEEENQKEYDVVRFEELEAMGYQILRVKNEEVIINVEKVVAKILEFKRLSPSFPLPQRKRDVTK
jgi:very-short-patch-repair endonuclease